MALTLFVTTRIPILVASGVLKTDTQLLRLGKMTEVTYIFNEAVHLIEKHEMPFNSCVNIVVSDAEKEAEMQRWLAEDANS